MNKQELNIILEEGEGYFTEFKESVSKLDKEIVAFANSSGGRIFLGISDSSAIKGFKLDNKTKSEIQNIAENCDPPIRITIEKYENIVIINVPEGNRKPYKCSSGFYLRTGANSQKMSTEDIVAFVQNEGRVKFDEIYDKRFNFEEDFDRNRYNTFIRKCGISSDYDFKEVLKNLGVLAFEDSKVFLNNTGILFFAKYPERIFLQSVVTGVLYKGTEKINILDRKDFKGDIISNVEDAILFLKKHLNISYKIQKLQREDILEIPETALREAIINSVVHRDYFEKGANVIIEIYDDRVEISNPGGLPKGLKESEFGTKSVTRNTLIASLMLRANYIEKLGTGIKRIQDAMKDANLPPVQFEKNSFFTIKFQRILKKIYSDKKDKNVGANVGVNVENAGIKFSEEFAVNFGVKGKRLERLIEILRLIDVSKFISAKDYTKNVPVNVPVNVPINEPVNERTIKRDLTFLKRIGFIERIGSNKTGHYVTTDKFREFLKEVNENTEL